MKKKILKLRKIIIFFVFLKNLYTTLKNQPIYSIIFLCTNTGIIIDENIETTKLQREWSNGEVKVLDNLDNGWVPLIIKLCLAILISNEHV